MCDNDLPHPDEIIVETDNRHGRIRFRDKMEEFQNNLTKIGLTIDQIEQINAEIINDLNEYFSKIIDDDFISQWRQLVSFVPFQQRLHLLVWENADITSLYLLTKGLLLNQDIHKQPQFTELIKIILGDQDLFVEFEQLIEYSGNDRLIMVISQIIDALED